MKRLAILVGLMVGLSLTIFFVGSIATDRAKYNNDFIRIFPPHAADPVSVFKVDGRRFSFAGQSDNVIYLRDRSVRGGVIIISLNMIDTVWMNLSIPSDSELIVDSPYFFIQNGSIASLNRGDIQNQTLDTTFTGLPGFTTVQPISSNTAILRTIDLNKRENVLVKSSLPDGPKYVLKRQVDGILCTDGYLQYSKEYHRLIYTYRYRNQFIVLDTSLNVQLSGKTIDTTSIARISVAEVNGKLTMSKPPFIVNKRTSVNGKYLFVHSNLTAKNESVDQFKDASAIDVYNILDGSYRFSFYIDNYGDERIQSFSVQNLVLMAVFRSAVVRYDLPSKYLP